MKTKLLGLLALVPLLGLSPANATTFDWSISSPYTYVQGSGTLTATNEGGGEYLVTSISGSISASCAGNPCKPQLDQIVGLLPIDAIETYDLDNDNLIYYDVTPQYSSIAMKVGTPNVCGVIGCGFIILGYGSEDDDPGGVGYYINVVNNGQGPLLSFSLSMDDASAAPLPAALPLFATGLGAMGLLGWRRKRKNTAAIAAA
jgi:hypothetical protein